MPFDSLSHAQGPGFSSGNLNSGILEAKPLGSAANRAGQLCQQKPMTCPLYCTVSDALAFWLGLMGHIALMGCPAWRDAKAAEPRSRIAKETARIINTYYSFGSGPEFSRAGNRPAPSVPGRRRVTTIDRAFMIAIPSGRWR